MPLRPGNRKQRKAGIEASSKPPKHLKKCRWEGVLRGEMIAKRDTTAIGGFYEVVEYFLVALRAAHTGGLSSSRSREETEDNDSREASTMEEHDGQRAFDIAHQILKIRKL